MKVFLFGMVLVCAFVSCDAQTVNDRDSLRRVLDGWVASNEAADRERLEGRLEILAASDSESDMSLAVSYYYRIKNVKASDSVLAAEIRKFPKGLEARLRAQQAITRMNSLGEMEKAYRDFVRDFPPAKYVALPLGEDRLPYDRIRSSLANGYAKEKNVSKASFYAGLFEADFWKVRAYSDLSEVFYANGDLVNAALFQGKAVESARPYAEGKMGKSAAASFAAGRYAEECGVYARILCEQKNYAGALGYIERAIAGEVAGAGVDKGVVRPVFDYTYAKVLSGLGRDKEAFDRIEAAVRSGQATEEMSALFRVLYIKVKGSDAGLDAYQAEIRKGVMHELRARLRKDMIMQPAADFSLTDLEGKKVMLSDLKGKVVIIDFWATWCVPCKASFPAMQAAVDKYRNDTGVVFLFIHTWERSPTATADAKTFILGMKYDFEVLMDTKDPETKANKVVDSYNVSGIPTKFIIDGEGKIRFRLTGFSGSKEAAVDEISMMIDIVRERG